MDPHQPQYPPAEFPAQYPQHQQPAPAPYPSQYPQQPQQQYGQRSPQYPQQSGYSPYAQQPAQSQYAQPGYAQPYGSQVSPPPYSSQPPYAAQPYASPQADPPPYLAAATSAEARQAVVNRGKRDVIFGAVWLAVGLGITVCSFAYFGGVAGLIAWGPAAYGIYKIIKGVVTINRG